MKKIITLLLCTIIGIGSVSCGKEETALEAIKKKGEIVLLTNASFPPFEFFNGKEIVGFDIAVGEAIAKKLGVTLKIEDLDFGLLIDALKGDKGDFIAAGFTANEEREKQVDFSQNYVETQQVVIFPEDVEITSLDDLKNLVIAVQESTTSDYAVEDLLVDTPDNVLRFKGTVEAGMAIANGKAQAGVFDKLPAESLAKNHNLKTLEGLFDAENMVIAVKKGSKELLDVINEVIKELKDSGELTKLMEAAVEEAVSLTD